MASSPVTQVRKKIQKAFFVAESSFNDCYSIRLYIGLAIHCYTSEKSQKVTIQHLSMATDTRAAVTKSDKC